MDFYTFLFGDGSMSMAFIPAMIPLVSAMSGGGGGAMASMLPALGKALPFLGSAIFGNLFKSKQKRLEEEQLGLQNQAMKMGLSRQRQMEPFMMQSMRGAFGRLPDHMQGSLNQFDNAGSALNGIARLRMNKGFDLPNMER